MDIRTNEMEKDMVCKNCKTVYSYKYKYCPNCGAVSEGSETGIRRIDMKCKACNGEMTYDRENNMLVCPYCDTTELLKESEAIQIEKIKNDAFREVEMAKLRFEEEKEKNKREEKRISEFRKGKFSKVLMGFGIFELINTCVMFEDEIYMCFFIALLQMILFFLAWFVGNRTIRIGSGGLYKILGIIAFLLFIPFFLLYDSDYTSIEKVKWKEIQLGEYIPEPWSEKAVIWYNDNEKLKLEYKKSDNSNYESYKEKCIEFGYDVETLEESNKYTAFNEEGYKLIITYYDFDDSIEIELKKPVEMSDITWPVTNLTKNLPSPESLYGNIESYSNNYFKVQVGNTSFEEYEKYVEKCINTEYGIDYSKTQRMFYGKNSKGDTLNIEYIGFNVMEIILYNWD